MNQMGRNAIGNDLQRAYQQVWKFRGQYNRFWRTPEPVNCLRYAVTEAAEALDAWLREERSKDARNQQKEKNVIEELADCAIMLLSSIQPEDPVSEWLLKSLFEYPYPSEKVSLDAIVTTVADALKYYNAIQSMSFGGGSVIIALRMIANYPYMQLNLEIGKRLERIWVKHVGPQGAAK